MATEWLQWLYETYKLLTTVLVPRLKEIDAKLARNENDFAQFRELIKELDAKISAVGREVAKIKGHLSLP